MAGREDEEIFTDLLGNPDPVVDADLAVLDDESGLGDLKPVKNDKGEVDPLLIPDDDEEDTGAAAAAAAADTDEEEEEEEADEGAPAAAAANDFDPKDVQLLLGETRNLELRENVEKANVDRAKNDFEAAKAALIKAKEDGDSAAEVAAMEKFADAKTAHGNATNALQNIENEKIGLAQRARALMEKAPKDGEGKPILDRRVDTAPAPSAEKPKGSKLVPKFLEQNAWFNDPKHAAKADVLRSLDKALAAEKKLNKNDPAYFVELGKRFNRQYPGMYKGLDGKLIATGQRQRGAGAPGPDGAGGGSNSGGGGKAPAGKIKLTNEDLVLMKRFQMDPNNMEHRRIWLTEKTAQERGAA